MPYEMDSRESCAIVESINAQVEQMFQRVREFRKPRSWKHLTRALRRGCFAEQMEAQASIIGRRTPSDVRRYIKRWKEQHPTAYESFKLTTAKSLAASAPKNMAWLIDTVLDEMEDCSIATQ
jgi:hypothetical protein